MRAELRASAAKSPPIGDAVAAALSPLDGRRGDMAKNRVSLELGDAELAEMDAALDTLDRVLAGFVSLSARDRRHMPKMGERSEVFCRQTLRLLVQKPQVVPPSLDVSEA